ncbi:Uncharacterised protein [Streptococcus criceti]|uniref:Uncharacterized protein n=1 Tax=Streptococcus criceti HS-6 TaxID=873449 RepID=G5JPD9_STRCG|nr:hypothetical protein [Streptococcus criceti]EHI75483.1 hypothetical protein STRCR_1591 [Streptococcus criceti HS-6]SUN43467.1 Uncharacterised protein [Streptococcus criceti]
MSKRTKNILQRILVILALLVSLALFVWLMIEAWHIQELATQIGVHFTNKTGKLASLDSPVQKLIFIFAIWLALQIVFFLGLLIHFFKATKNDQEQDSRRVNDSSHHRRRRHEEDEEETPRHRSSEREEKEASRTRRRHVSTEFRDDYDEEGESDKDSTAVDTELEELPTRRADKVTKTSDDDDYLEVPKPVGRRSRKDRH